jgi:DNA-binding transcriptional regulator of glucitol operon
MSEPEPRRSLRHPLARLSRVQGPALAHGGLARGAVAPSGNRAVRAVRTTRAFLSPAWIGLHLLFLGAAIGMIFLGRWQLQVSNRRHFDLQNFSYVIQWWTFSAFAIFFWLRLIRDAHRPRTSAASTSGEIVLRHGQELATYVGPANFISQPSKAGQAPVVYRGYVAPSNARTPVPSHGDRYHDSYNDYLWQLALADSAATTTLRTQPRPQDGELPGAAAADQVALEQGIDRAPPPGDIGALD